MNEEYGEVKLIQKAYAQDCIGQPIDLDQDARLIPCKIGNVTRSEWNSAHQGGYEAEIMLKVFSGSYNGEKSAIWHGVRYEIYRTYRVGDETELYLGNKAGTG